MSGDFYPWLFQHGYFQRPPTQHVFSTQSVKYKVSKTSPECYVKIVHITFQCKRNYVVSIILQISVLSETRAANIV